jgi:hypothetical protein
MGENKIQGSLSPGKKDFYFSGASIPAEKALNPWGDVILVSTLSNLFTLSLEK